MTECNTQTTSSKVPHTQIVSAAENFFIRKKGCVILSGDSLFDIVAWEPEEEILHFANCYQCIVFPENGTEITRLEFENGMCRFITENIDEMERIGNNFKICYDECHMNVVNPSRAILRLHENCFNDGADISQED